MMTAQDYINAGFRVSTQISQTEINRAEADVIACYIAKVCTYDSADTVQREAIMQLSFILLCQRNTVATRAGGKIKLSPQLSDNAQARQTDYDNADRLLRRLQQSQTGIAGDIAKMVDDVAMIYLRSYLSM